jgi:AAA domain
VISSLCFAVANGTPFLGLPTVRRCVLYLDAENSRKRITKRFERLHITDGPNFKYVGLHTFGAIINYVSPDIIKWVESCKVKPIIVIDSLRAYLQGDESSSKDIRAFFMKVDQLKNAGAAVIIIHHTGKGENTKEYRGSSDIKAAIDVGYVLTNDGGTRLKNLTLAAFKMRDEVIEQLDFRYDDGNFVPSCPQSHCDDIVCTLLFDEDGMLKTELETAVMAKAKATRAKVRESLMTLLANRIIAITAPIGKHAHNAQMVKLVSREYVNATIRNGQRRS